MRPPRFPLDRTQTYTVVRGVVLFFHHGSWCIRYRRNGKKAVESLAIQDDRLAYDELQKRSRAFIEGATPQEIIQSRHHSTCTVGEAAKAFSQEYKEIALGTQRKLRGHDRVVVPAQPHLDRHRHAHGPHDAARQ